MIRDYDDLVEFLDERDYNGRAVVASAATWYQERGFLGPDPFLGVPLEAAPISYYESLDDATLEQMRIARDTGALQTIAARAAFVDPFEALRLYEQAMYFGSVQATLQYSSLLDTLRQMPQEDFAGDPQFSGPGRRLAGVTRGMGAESAPFVYAVTAYRDAGPALGRTELLQWLLATASQIESEDIKKVCRRADLNYIVVAEGRRAAGGPPLSIDPPAVFLSIPDIEDKLPCRTTDYPVYSILDTTNCDVESVIGPSGQPRDLHICSG